MDKTKFRLEHDSIGEMEVPKDAYYGVHALRGKNNFPITGAHMDSYMIRGAAEVKKAAALTNAAVGRMDEKIAKAIAEAADKVITGDYDDQFIVDPVQGGAGTSFNMNTNEVIANLAIEILGGEKGDYSLVHPNDHVNFGQSTNDSLPSAGKIAILRHLIDVEEEGRKLVDALDKKSKEFDSYIKMGRTHLQDAVPIRLGQEFAAYRDAVKRNVDLIESAIAAMSVMNMGATAVGTGLNADQNYVKQVVPKLAEVTGLDLVQTDNLVDGTQGTDSYVYVSGILKALAMALSKMCNDLRLMASGPRTGLGEINLPAKQAGSSIMPGKVNPVIAEVTNQTAFLVAGNDLTITMAMEAAQFELNVMEPVLFYKMFESLKALRGAMYTLRVNLVEGLEANVERMEHLVENSVGVITAIVPHVGYENAANIAKKAIKTGRPVRELALESGLLSEEDLNKILDPMGMTEPGISAAELLNK
ncbi:aspartate ammonia-lyase [Neofamilia massiliensis]|uniref:aspartate ammonia-lyase n=1 Tax=Neofamilia massiliensis TaxID=1673724 RepID=UPI0006BB86BC|nr:aspartate ammonia-lyase [Neofamilia massiliensis]